MSGQGKSEAYLSNGKEGRRCGEAWNRMKMQRDGIAYIRNGIGAMCKAKLWRGPVKHGGGIAQIGMTGATDRIDVSCDAMA